MSGDQLRDTEGECAYQALQVDLAKHKAALARVGGLIFTRDMSCMDAIYKMQELFDIKGNYIFPTGGDENG